MAPQKRRPEEEVEENSLEDGPEEEEPPTGQSAESSNLLELFSLFAYQSRKAAVKCSAKKKEGPSSVTAEPTVYLRPKRAAARDCSKRNKDLFQSEECEEVRLKTQAVAEKSGSSGAQKTVNEVFKLKNSDVPRINICKPSAPASNTVSPDQGSPIGSVAAGCPANSFGGPEISQNPTEKDLPAAQIVTEILSSPANLAESQIPTIGAVQAACDEVRRASETANEQRLHQKEGILFVAQQAKEVATPPETAPVETTAEELIEKALFGPNSNGEALMSQIATVEELPEPQNGTVQPKEKEPKDKLLEESVVAPQQEKQPGKNKRRKDDSGPETAAVPLRKSSREKRQTQFYKNENICLLKVEKDAIRWGGFNPFTGKKEPAPKRKRTTNPKHP
ncbi:unnamed protein product [Caenorhabditis auriculariae]|uniref:Uncharacterized protein n=1 Tax=Caenorhabditis auriculariae TaxID=2777116 RepID=A0A8S1H9C0_9PELO|nr:unnamed protein product [Caenorhabditis auriculariae]